MIGKILYPSLEEATLCHSFVGAPGIWSQVAPESVETSKPFLATAASMAPSLELAMSFHNFVLYMFVSSPGSTSR